MTLYQIKPLFQSLLRPTMFWLYKHHVTANHITLAALALSLLTGLLLMLAAQPILFLLLPIVLFIRMALNALDGMLARECNQQTRVVSLPSTDIFDAQDEEYRESVLPSNVAARVAVEAGIADYWYKYVGLKGAIVGMTGYGESAPADKLFPFFGFTAENIVAKAHKVLGVKGA